MKYLYILLSLFLFLKCTSATNINIDISKDIIIPKKYIVQKLSDSLIIDGYDNEIDWKNIPFSDEFIDIENNIKPAKKTKMKMLWDDNFLYVFAKLWDDHIWGDITKRDEIIYYNNDFEIFIDPDGDTYNYGEIEINTLGTEWDLFLNKPYRLGGKAQTSWNIQGLKSSVKVNGTINNPSDSDNYWTVEFAIPLDEISKLKKDNSDNPIIGEQWRINFSRVQWEYDLNNGKYSRKKVDNKYLPEYNWVWSRQGKINMHIPENWGFIQFSDNMSETNFKELYNIELQQIAYSIFRKIRFNNLIDYKNINQNKKLNLSPISFNGKIYMASFLKTKNGFRIDVYEKENKNDIYRIEENGIIEKLKI
tara:strand:- start:1189 stop:2277 length:1089 start_codon:yes stop_codon:yes gene_type:complete